MKKKVLLTSIAIALQLAIASLPFLPVLKRIVPDNPNARQQLDAIIFCVGLSFAITAAYLGAIFVLQDVDASNLRQQLQATSPARVIAMRDDDFYTAFLAAAKQASSHVYISYLAQYAPAETGDSERMEYYSALLNLIKQKPNVRFRRLVRVSERTDKWLKNLLESLEGIPNADVASLDEPESEMPLALSVQVIDLKQVWFVAIESHERVGVYRDLYIENEAVADAMAKYFTRLWDRSTPLLDSGRLTEAGQQVGKRRAPRGASKA